MSLLSALVVTALGAVCAVGTVWWALRAERAYGAAPAPQRALTPTPEPAWWESAEWWPALSSDEQQWVLRNLAAAGHSTADAALRRDSTPE